jgi:hypothetical protein
MKGWRGIPSSSRSASSSSAVIGTLAVCLNVPLLSPGTVNPSFLYSAVPSGITGAWRCWGGQESLGSAYTAPEMAWFRIQGMKLEICYIRCPCLSLFLVLRRAVGDHGGVALLGAREGAEWLGFVYTSVNV